MTSPRLLPLAIALGLAFSPAVPVHAQGPSAPAFPVAGLNLRPNGVFLFDGVEAVAGHFDRGWVNRIDQSQLRVAPGFPKRAAGTWQVRGTLAVKDAPVPLTLTQRLGRIDARAFSAAYEVACEAKSGLPTSEVFLQFGIPLSIGAGKSVLIDGVAHPLPVAFGQSHIFGDRQRIPRTLILPAATGTITITGTFSLLMQDQRQWKRDAYAVRINFPVTDEVLTRSALEVTVRHTPHSSTPLSLRSAANFGFRDEVAGDGKGGWTDQGADNDIRSLPAGPLAAAGVNFEILDDSPGAPTPGRAALVLGKSDQTFLPKNATLPVSGVFSSPPRNLYLLHAAGWLPPSGRSVGTVVLRQIDGSETRREIVSGRDIGNWRSPAPLPDAAVGWTGENPRGTIGLYVSRVPLPPGKPLSEIRFENTGEAIWMVAALSLSPDDIVPFTPQTPWTVQAGPEWVAFDHRHDIEAGSVFDFSSYLDAPAGKHGALVVTPAGHFAFEKTPADRVRFWGVNLCFSANYLEKDEADRLAERLARSGYNSIRIHHYDRELQLKGGLSHELDPQKLDRLDYLFAAMKKRGLYINIDLYTSRAFSPAEFAAFGFDTATDPDVASGQMHWRFKAVMPVSELAFETWSKFAANLLTHRNPYTGLTWAEDPALIGICPVNEDSPSERIDNDPVINRLYREAFVRWRGQPESHLLPAAAGETEATAFNRFVYEAHIRHDARMADFLRNRLGVRALLSGTNYRNSQELAYVRTHYDYVDNHMYWDHPTFPVRTFNLPFQFDQAGAIRRAAPVPREVMPTRLVGKPFAVTEFNFVRPNRYRAEGAVLMPAYAGLQDWDALYNFDYASSRGGVNDPGQVSSIFSLASDPVGLIGDRVGAALFRRGDIAPARGGITFAVQDGAAFSQRERRFPNEFSRLGLVTRIGSRPASPDTIFRENRPAAVVVDPQAGAAASGANRVYPATSELADRLRRDGVLPGDSISDDGKRYRSDTGQIELQTEAGTLRVITERSELFVLPAGAQLEGGRVSVRNGETFGSIAVVAVDGRPVAESDRLLVVHLTDALRTGMHFGGQDRRLLEKIGTSPYLVQRGSADITLRLAGGGPWKAWAVSPAGARLREVSLTRNADGSAWTLRAETVTVQGTQLAYELARK
ncbi:hypothetical protein OPIT5_07565 [Opitutaceae bacterium TAV5]|nr:hypothetical protein OPIT5_07565 [Opitutaceae bacterium TAV5]